MSILPQQRLCGVGEQGSDALAVRFVELVQPGGGQVVPHEHVGDPFFPHRCTNGKAQFRCGEKPGEQAVFIRLFEHRLEPHVVPAVAEEKAQHPGIRRQGGVGEPDGRVFGPEGGDVVVTAHFAAQVGQGVDHGKLFAQVTAVVGQHQAGNADRDDDHRHRSRTACARA